MRNLQGIGCSIIYGQDSRFPISADTSHILYVAYRPIGISIEIIEGPLQQIEENIRTFSPQMIIEPHQLLSAISS